MSAASAARRFGDWSLVVRFKKGEAEILTAVPKAGENESGCLDIENNSELC